MNAEQLVKAMADARYANIKTALEKAMWPETICSQTILADQGENKNSTRGDLNKGMAKLGYGVLKNKNSTRGDLNKGTAKLGYGVLKNKNSKDGRRKIGRKNATMYFKLPPKTE